MSELQTTCKLPIQREPCPMSKVPEPFTRMRCGTLGQQARQGGLSTFLLLTLLR